MITAALRKRVRILDMQCGAGPRPWRQQRPSDPGVGGRGIRRFLFERAKLALCGKDIASEIARLQHRPPLEAPLEVKSRSERGSQLSSCHATLTSVRSPRFSHRRGQA